MIDLCKMHIQQYQWLHATMQAWLIDKIVYLWGMDAQPFAESKEKFNM